MKFSVVLPSYLESYAGAATNRGEKLIRAVNSTLSQTFDDFELHVIADGCQKTVDLITDNIKDTRVHLWKTQHKKLWSGAPRNKGIDEALGEWIIYLDNDDILGPQHLEKVAAGLNGFDWVWFNDIRYKPYGAFWYENQCDIHQIGRHGTSNLCHKRSLGVRWDEDGKYAHDYYFTQKLLKFKNFAKIGTPEYYVAHVPGNGISGGYEQ